MNFEKELPFLMQVAKLTASRSKLRRKKVGAVIVDSFGRIISTGYNGGISGGDDSLLEKKIYSHNDLIDGNEYPFEDEHGKYRLVSDHNRIIHAEQNAMMYAARRGLSIDCCTAICTLSPCVKCASLMIQGGIFLCYYEEEHESILDTKKYVPQLMLRQVKQG